MAWFRAQANLDENPQLHDTPEYTNIFLESLCFKHIAFLKRLHESGVTKRVPSESHRRYRGLWLPLVALSYDNSTQREKDIIPPSDVAWLWHCHRLAPAGYKAFIEDELVSYKGCQEPSILDLNDPADPYSSQSNNPTKIIWGELYSEEPFLLSRSEDEAAVDVHGTILGFD